MTKCIYCLEEAGHVVALLRAPIDLDGYICGESYETFINSVIVRTDVWYGRAYTLGRWRAYED